MSLKEELAKILDYWRDTIRRNADATNPEELAEVIIKELRLVQLDEDQSLPPRSASHSNPMYLSGHRVGYLQCYDNMKVVGFRKVKERLPHEALGISHYNVFGG